MTDQGQKPIIFLAFANEQIDSPGYLRNLRKEAKQLRKLLDNAQQDNLCQAVVEESATLKDILDVFQDRRYRNRIAIFHYAGHANGYQLLLESESGTVGADAGGLAAFLGQQTGLQLVFLNGCSTQQQVEGLLAADVPVVIATSQAIKDDVATDFASRFYQGLVGGASLRAAYNEAEAALQAALDSSSTRQLYSAEAEIDEALTSDWPWDLYLREDDKTVDQWSLLAHFVNQHIRSRLPFEPEIIYIPGGEFWMGSDKGEGVQDFETPKHKVDLPHFFIGKYPVTNEQYAEFSRGTGHLVPPEAGWSGQTPPSDKLNHPVAGVTWYDALEYCQWLSEETGRQYSLPSEAQWEKAARGINGRRYPWGEEWEDGCCNHGQNEIMPVDAYPPQSEYGCYDMVGNVREWTSSLWGKRMIAPDPEYGYPWGDTRADRNELAAPRNIHRVYRGGAVADDKFQLRCAARNGFDPTKKGEQARKWHGFRVVLNL